MGIHDLLLVVFTAVAGAAAAPARNWTDISGQFSVEADMVGFQDGVVHLKRVDGKVVKVPLEKFSPADQAFARQAAVSSPKTELPAAAADHDPGLLPALPHRTARNSASAGSSRSRILPSAS